MIEQGVFGLTEIGNVRAVTWKKRSAFMRRRRKVSEGVEAVSQDLFRARLDAFFDFSNPLATLCQAMPWAVIESSVMMRSLPAPAGAGLAKLSSRL